jgi:hypothetical protein
MGHADHPHRRSWAGNGECRGDGLGRSRAFEGRVGADPAGQFHDGLGRSLASGLDDVGGAELLGDRLTVGMAAQGDDAAGTQPAGGQDGGQPDCPVADDRHDIAAPHTCADGRVVTGRHDVGEREQRSQRLI